MYNAIIIGDGAEHVSVVDTTITACSSGILLGTVENSLKVLSIENSKFENAPIQILNQIYELQSVTIENSQFQGNLGVKIETNNISTKGRNFIVSNSTFYSIEVGMVISVPEMGVSVAYSQFHHCSNVALAIKTSGSTIVTESVFENNYDPMVVEYSSSVVVDRCLFKGNSGQFAGGIYFKYYSTTTEVTNSEFFQNYATGEAPYSLISGGAILGQNLAISYCKFYDNVGYSGAVYATNNVSIDNSQFIRNTGSYGGALGTGGDEGFNITNSSFEDNWAQYGGAIYNLGNILSITNVSLRNNKAQNTGGAILIPQEGIAVISNSSITENSASSGGGIFAKGSLTLDFVVISDNKANSGGGFTCVDTTVKMEVVTITSNEADDGAAYYCQNCQVSSEFVVVDNNNSIDCPSA